jgi:hypothetical protein
VSDLIAALTILLKYGDPYAPTNCVHDELWANIDPGIVSAQDKGRLEALGFSPEGEMFKSFRFGSC